MSIKRFKDEHFTFWLPNDSRFGANNTIVSIVKKLGGLGATGISGCDDQLVPPGTSPADCDQLVSQFITVCTDYDIVVDTWGTDLSSHPMCGDGAFTARDENVRNVALGKALRAIDMAHALGASNFGISIEPGRLSPDQSPTEDLFRLGESISFLSDYIENKKYQLKIILGVNPTSPRECMLLPGATAIMSFIKGFIVRKGVGVTLSIANERVVGSYVHTIAQALADNYLLDLNFDQQIRPGSDPSGPFVVDDPLGLFHTVETLQTEEYLGALTWTLPEAEFAGNEAAQLEFAKACMGTYVLFADAVSDFTDWDNDEIRALTNQISDNEAASLMPDKGFSPEAAAQLKALQLDDEMSGEPSRDRLQLQRCLEGFLRDLTTNQTD